MHAWSAFATEVGACINLYFWITWENEVLWAPSGRKHNPRALCWVPSSVACPLFQFDSLWQACDMNTSALNHNVIWSTRMIECRGTLHWHRNVHLSSLPSTETEVWNQLWSRLAITYNLLIWTDLGLCYFSQFFQVKTAIITYMITSLEFWINQHWWLPFQLIRSYSDFPVALVLLNNPSMGCSIHMRHVI